MVVSWPLRESLISNPHSTSTLILHILLLSSLSYVIDYMPCKFSESSCPRKRCPCPNFPYSVLAWLNDDDDDFMYTEQQVARFPFFHLEARDWYLDYFEGFVPKAKEVLLSSLVDTTPMEPVPLDELEEV